MLREWLGGLSTKEWFEKLKLLVFAPSYPVRMREEGTLIYC
jgi:hypothetical protein